MPYPSNNSKNQLDCFKGKGGFLFEKNLVALANGDVTAVCVKRSTVHDRLRSVPNLLDEVDPTILNGVEVRIFTIDSSV